MASNAAKVRRRAEALNRLDTLSKLLSENLKVEMPDVRVTNRDAELAEIQRIESINALLEGILKASDVEVPEIATEELSEESEAANVPDTKPDLSEMKKAELLEEAERRGVEISKSHTKAEIIEALNGN